ncbi:MAG: hypothetical protein ACUVRQ_07215, partial [Thermoanaerobaculaceae bacterium]
MPRRPLFAVLCFLHLPAFLCAQGLFSELVPGLKARSIGPAAMSGRVAAIDAAPGNPGLIF